MHNEITTTQLNGKTLPVYIRRDTCREFDEIMKSFDGPILVYDLETTGLNRKLDRVVQIAVVKLQKDLDGRYQITDRLNQYINPGFPMPKAAAQVNHISDDLLRNQPDEDTAFPVIEQFFGDVDHGACVVAGYNIESFDNKMMDALYKRQGREGFAPKKVIDIMRVAMELVDRRNLKDGSFKQEYVAEHLGCLQKTMHDALTDVYVSGHILWKLYAYYTEYIKAPEGYFENLPKVIILGMNEVRFSKECNYIYINVTGKINGELRTEQVRYDIYNRRYLDDSGVIFTNVNMLDFSYAADRYAGGEIRKYRTARKR